MNATSRKLAANAFPQPRPVGSSGDGVGLRVRGTPTLAGLARRATWRGFGLWQAPNGERSAYGFAAHGRVVFA